MCIRDRRCAARLVVKKRKWESITPMHDNLHWLLVGQRVDFKICLLVYKYSVFSSSPRHTSCRWSVQFRQSLHVANCARQVKVTWFWLCQGLEQQASVHEAFQSLVRWCGTVYHRKWRRHLSHWDSSLAGWKLNVFTQLLFVSTAVIIFIIRLRET